SSQEIASLADKQDLKVNSALPPGPQECADCRLSSAIQHAGEAFVSTDNAGVIQYVNPAFERMTGYSSAEVVGRTPRILKSGAQDPGFYQELWRTIAGGRTWRGELTNRRKDGSLYIEAMTIAPVRDASGTLSAYIALKEDVTERRRMEEGNRFLATLVDSTDDAIIGATLDGLISSWNHSAERIYGYSASEVIGESLAILSPAGRVGELEELLTRLRQGESITGFETVRVAKSGHPIDVSLTTSPIRNPDGTVAGAAIIARDIGHRRRVERAARESVEQFRALFERSSDYVYLVDFRGNLLDANPACLSALGYSHAEFRTLNLASLLTPDQVPKAFEVLQEGRETGSLAEPVEFRVRRRGGTFLDVETSGALIPLGSERAAIGIARDVTERKRAEEALRESEQQFRELAGHIDGVFWIFDVVGGDVRYISPAYREIWGRDPEEARRNPTAWAAAVVPEDRMRAIAAIRGEALAGRPAVVE